MSTIREMLKAVRKATGNAAASDAFLGVLEEREVDARFAQSDKEHLGIRRSALKMPNRWLIFIGFLLALSARPNLIGSSSNARSTRAMSLTRIGRVVLDPFFYFGIFFHVPIQRDARLH